MSMNAQWGQTSVSRTVGILLAHIHAAAMLDTLSTLMDSDVMVGDTVARYYNNVIIIAL